MQKIKNLLLTSSGFSPKNYNSHEWEILALAELAKKGSVGTLKEILKKRDKFYIGRGEIDDPEFKYLLFFILFLANALDKKIVDNFNNESRLNISRFLFIQTPKFIAEIICGVFSIIVVYLQLLFFNFQKGKFAKSSSKKIAFLRTDYFGKQKTGGSFSHGQGFISGILKENWQIFALAQEKFFNQGIPFYQIPYSKFFLDLPEIPEIAYHFKFIKKALPTLKKEKPVFIYQRHSFMNASGAILAKKLNLPLILEYNGPEVWVREKWGGFLILKKLAILFEMTQLKFSDKIAVVSEALVEELVQRGIAKEKIILNPNGVEVEKFGPGINGTEIRKKHHVQDSEILVGFLGTFGAWHGAEILAKAVKPIINQLKVKSLEFRVKFLMVGDGPLRPLVEKILKDDGVENYVILTGLILHSEISKYLAACDILVSPHIPNPDGSKFFGSPTKLFEYMASQKAIAASDLDQIGKVLKHNETALLGRPGNVDDLVKNIVILVKDKNLREKLAKNARKEAEKNYTWQENAKRVIKAYETIP